VPLPPHAPKEECEKYELYGCGKPFRINEKEVIEICGYI
jgi:hypothetical protein